MNNFSSRKQMSGVLAFGLLLAGVPSLADTSNVFGESVELLGVPDNAAQIVSDVTGDNIWLAELVEGQVIDDEYIPATGEAHEYSAGAFQSRGDSRVDSLNAIEPEGPPYTVDPGIRTVAISDDGLIVAMLDANGRAYVRDAGIWSDLLRDVPLPEDGYVSHLELSGDGSRVFVGLITSEVVGDSSVDTLNFYALNRATGTRWFSFGPAHAVALNPDWVYEIVSNSNGTRVAYVGSGFGRVFELGSNLAAGVQRALSIPIEFDFFAPEFAIEMSSNGQVVVVADSDRQYVAVSTDGGERFAKLEPELLFGPGQPDSFENQAPGLAVSISADGSHIAILSGGYVALSRNSGGSWTPVYSGGRYGIDIALVGENELLTLFRPDGGQPSVERSSLNSIEDSGAIPARELDGSPVLPTKQFFTINKSNGPIEPGAEVGEETGPWAFSNFEIGPAGLPIAGTPFDLYSWNSSSWQKHIIGTNPIFPITGSLAYPSPTGLFYYSGLGITPDLGGNLEVIIGRTTYDAPNEPSEAISTDFPGVLDPDTEKLGPLAADTEGNFYFAVNSSDYVSDFESELHVGIQSGDFFWSFAVSSGTPIMGNWIAIESLGKTVVAANKYGETRGGKGLWIRDIDAATWSSIDLPEEASTSWISAFSAGATSAGVTSDDRTLAFVSDDFAGSGYISTDGGETWALVEQGNAFKHVEVSPDGQYIAFFSNYSITLSKDGGETFVQIATSVGQTQKAIFYELGDDTRLLFNRARGDLEEDSYDKFLDVSLADSNLLSWDGSFSDEAQPTWSTQIWDPSSYYVPNYMLASADGVSEEVCDTGFVGGECGAVSFSDVGLNISGSTYLDPCSEDLTEFCIESLRVAGSNGILRTANLQSDRPLGGFSWDIQSEVTADRSFNLPAAGQPSLWEAPLANHSGISNLYSVNAVVEFRYNPETGLTFPNYSATVIPVDMFEGPGYQRVTATDSGSGFSWTGNDNSCAWNDEGICAKRQLFLPNSRVELTVRIPKDVAGWYKGRVFDPKITAEQISETSNRVTISGSPAVKLPFLEDVKVTIDETPASFQATAFKLLGSGGLLISDSDRATVRFINAVKNAQSVQDQSNATNSIWQFSTLQLPTADLCYQQIVNDEGPGAIIGMVSTDAMAYSGKPPSLVNGSLNYSIAGLHKYEDGAVVRASYSLSVREDYARCAYGITGTLNPAVEVYENSTGDEKEGITFNSVNYLSNGVEWWKVNVSGITFSNPTISISLTGGSTVNQSDPGGFGGVPTLLPTLKNLDVACAPAGVESSAVLFGEGLSEITSARIAGLETKVSSVTAESLILTVPALSSGIYDVTYVLGSTSVVHEDSLTICGNAGQKLYAKKRFANFGGSSSQISETDRRQILAFLKANPGIQHVTCVGSTSGVPATRSDLNLAKARAENACRLAKSVVPGITTRTVASAGKGVGRIYRSVTLYVRGIRPI